MPAAVSAIPAAAPAAMAVPLAATFLPPASVATSAAAAAAACAASAASFTPPLTGSGGITIALAPVPIHAAGFTTAPLTRNVPGRESSANGTPGIQLAHCITAPLGGNVRFTATSA